MIDKKNDDVKVVMGKSVRPDDNGNDAYESRIYVGDNHWFAGRGSSLAVSLGVAADYWRSSQTPATMKDQDWGEHELKLAERILVQLGIGYDASKEPGADQRRDRICAIIAESKQSTPDNPEWVCVAANTWELKSEVGKYTISRDSMSAGGTCYVWTPDQPDDSDYHSDYANLYMAKSFVERDIKHSLKHKRSAT